MTTAQDTAVALYRDGVHVNDIATQLQQSTRRVRIWLADEPQRRLADLPDTPPPKVPCEWCGDLFTRPVRPGRRQRFCTVLHRDRAWRANHTTRTDAYTVPGRPVRGRGGIVRWK